MDRLTEHERLDLQLQAAHRECLKADETHRREIRASLTLFDRAGGQDRWLSFVTHHQELRTA